MAATTESKSVAKKPVPKKGGAGKKPSAYNQYMKVQLAKLKEKNPEQPHTERFKLVAKMWASAPENPKASESKA
ncbi:YABBY protein [Phaffia rhodozyma]|uniref:YABBY protein n=1 Tax=Phaffia rhodozyma TaxID=264483 RepID=A0A0F7SMR8_PHARH|nr:YABBY protein [Phaffia rhodozyma]